MGSEFVQDPWWGNWASGLAKGLGAAPGVALHNSATVEGILAKREERARENAKWDAAQQASEAGVAAVPEASVQPSRRDETKKIQQNGPSDPATAPVGEVFLPPTTVTTQEQFIDPRLLAAAQARQAAAKAGIRATLLADPSKWAPQQAYGEVASTGPATDPRDRVRQQVQMTGRYPTAEETKTPNAQNFAVVDENGNGTGFGYSSLNGGRTAIDGTPIVLKPGQRIMETGPAPLSAPNALKDEASARERLAVLSRSIGPNGPTQDQAVQIQQLVDVAYKPTRVVEKVGDQNVVKYVQQNPIPSWVTAMMGAPPPAPGGVPAAPAPLAVPGGPVPAPLPVPTQAPINPNADRVVETQPGSAIELRKEYAALPEIKNYSTAANTWNAAVQSAYTGNKANDLAIVYGFIKLMDSLTGVRDAEVKMVGQVGSWGEQVNTMLGQANGKGLDPRTRVNIIETMQRHMNEIKSSAAEKEKFYTDTAAASGLAPKAVLAPLMPMAEFDRTRALAVRNERAGPASTTAPAATRTPPTEEEKAQLRQKLGAQ